MRASSLSGRTAIVTGASRGIGFAVASALHAAGTNVTLTARTQEAADRAAHELGDGALGVGAHATDERAAKACVDRTLDVFGSVDILVNNVGTNPAYGPVLDQQHAQFAKTMDVNLWTPILWTRLVVDAWMRRHGGSIVNNASIGGLVASSDIGIYGASKAALIHLTRQLAIELSPKVRVNAVAPGTVRTRLSEALWKDDEVEAARAMPLRRIGEPSDIGSAVCFLASADSSWITGETLVVDGGQMIGANPALEGSRRQPSV